MRYGSLFSGIEAASTAWHRLGWRPAFFSEIEPFPCKVLKHHYPDVENYGDITRYDQWPEQDLDLIVGGSPCQAFSDAGLRRGLADPRGNLMLTYLAVIARYRPRWMVWENVAAALHVSGGAAFSTLLQGVENLGYNAAWRVLDTQHVRTPNFPRALPQMRRRLFLVGYSGDWQAPMEVLFERGCQEGEAPPRGAEGCANGRFALRPTGFSEYARTNISGTVTTRSGANSDLLVVDEGGARKMTPTETERLMGFPDGYTALPGASESVRYKALGNSMTVNCMEWLGLRIQAADNRRSGA